MFFGAITCQFYGTCLVCCRLVSRLAVGLGEKLNGRIFFW